MHPQHDPYPLNGWPSLPQILLSIESRLGGLLHLHEHTHESSQHRFDRLDDRLQVLSERVTTIEATVPTKVEPPWWAGLLPPAREGLGLVALFALGLAGLLEGAEIKAAALALLTGGAGAP